MQNTKSIIFYSVLMVFTLHYSMVHAVKSVAKEAVADTAKNMSEVTQSMVNNITPLVCAYLGYVFVKDVATIGKDLYDYVYPDEEKMSREKEAEKKIAEIRTERAFRNCLIKNAQKSRNEEGFPVICEKCGRAFAIAAGEAAYHEMVEAFKAVS